MSIPVGVALTLGLVTFGIIAVLLVALARHLKLLALSLKRFQDEVQPLLEDVREGSERANERVETLSSRGESLKGGARLRS